MAKKKKSVKRKKTKKKHSSKTKKNVVKRISKKALRRFPSLDLRSDKDIAMDFAVKVYKKFDKLIKAVVLFGSTAKGSAGSGSDIDLILIVDDASVLWDQELIAWYREEMGKLVAKNPYKKELHITTTRLTTLWKDMIRGDPIIINVIRHGEALIDVGGFFNPIKSLLQQGLIRSTPEAIYTALQRAPQHFRRSQLAELNAIEGLYWAMVDSSQAALMAANVTPPSPEHLPTLLKETFVDKKMLDMKYATLFGKLYDLHKKIVHSELTDLKGGEIQKWQEVTDDFIGVMAKLVKQVIENKK
tara:strand:+ start:671 stop:1573 length:903 start_codon:yes stop_codon:yes gene_type:complete